MVCYSMPCHATQCNGLPSLFLLSAQCASSPRGHGDDARVTGSSPRLGTRPFGPLHGSQTGGLQGRHGSIHGGPGSPGHGGCLRFVLGAPFWLFYPVLATSGVVVVVVGGGGGGGVVIFFRAWLERSATACAMLVRSSLGQLRRRQPS